KGGSGALILGPTESPEFRDAAQLPPATADKPLTALIAPPPAIVREPQAALAPPIPLPPAPRARTVVTPVVKVKPPRPATRNIRMLVTAYCPCKKCCGKFSDNITASGKNVYSNRSMFVAADTRLLKFGTMLSVPGYHGARAVPVLDRGSRIRGRRLDVFFLSHRRARKWGSRYLDVKVHIDNR
ncbi:MAG: 3D domain-containing protein, partial [Planctomycetes bacterium]|nr:3D domain-containing protein [Planctomycetota bacterium]